MNTASDRSPAIKSPEHDEPIYWFAILEQALEQGDLQGAAVAHRELQRLGVDVSYRLRPRGIGGRP